MNSNLNDLIDEDLYNIQKQFLNNIPAKKLSFFNLFSSEKGSCDTQDALLNLTVCNTLVKKYPVKIKYQLSFIKTLIGKLESTGLEVSENLYTSYCSLLSSVDKQEDGTHYRHYITDNISEPIIVKESSSLISQGTTGLCSWQASKALAEWCLSNRSLFRNKRVLELGSGIGLTGLAVSLCCQPNSYWFSDCHPAVLDLLQSNITLNIVNLTQSVESHIYNNISEETGKDVLLSRKLKSTELNVLHLPWEQVNGDNARRINADIILAADVVYDDSISLDLVKALKELLFSKRPAECIVLIACTVRNPETLQHFLTLLNNAVDGLEVIEKETYEPKIFPYSDDSFVKIYLLRITH